MKNKYYFSFFLVTFLISNNVLAQYGRIELWGDSTELEISDDIQLVNWVQIDSISANTGDVFPEEYFNELHKGKFVYFSLSNMKVDKILLSYLKKIKAEEFIFNNCIFNDSVLNFDNKSVLYLRVNDCNIKRIGRSIRRIKQLRALSISSDIDFLPNWIFKLRKLNLLSLTNGTFSNLDRVLKYNSQLKHFTLACFDLECEDVIRIPDMLPGLVTLIIDGVDYNTCDEFKKRYDVSKYKIYRCN